MTFSNKDQLCQYLISGYVHLSKKDYSFFHNIIVQTKDNKPITSNQNNLFNKLLHKYKRQLTRLDHNIDNLVELEWRLGVIESRKEFLQAKISILENNLILKSPFNNQFIQNFRKIDLNPFNWNPKEKYYVAKCSTYALKIAHTYTNKFYKDVVYCERVQFLLNQLGIYNDQKCWTPTLVKTNDNYFIYGMNSSLYNHIKNIELNDDPITLFLLSQYGVSIHETVTKQKKLLDFAGSYNVTFDLNELDDIINMLTLLKVTHVFTARVVVYNKTISNEIKLKCLEKGITCSSIGDKINNEGVLLTTHSFDTHHDNFSKIIHLKNSRPVII
jgi:hypothetical protein